MKSPTREELLAMKLPYELHRTSEHRPITIRFETRRAAFAWLRCDAERKVFEETA